MYEQRRLLAVLAHPDDESFAIGGTLARYAAEGVEVCVTVATDGAAGSTDETWHGDVSQLADTRAEELKQAAEVLGVSVTMLGYHDSGYIGDPTNNHPEAFINGDKSEQIGRVVEIIRQFQPQVVITHDKTGGYFHPDHIRCHEITNRAFFAADDPGQFPDIGPAPYQPERLYYYVFTKRSVWIRNVIYRLRGMDPTKVGRNNDIDFTKAGIDQSQITTVIDARSYWALKRQAGAKHVSQGGGTSLAQILPNRLLKEIAGKESFVRAYPPPSSDTRERDLFES